MEKMKEFDSWLKELVYPQDFDQLVQVLKKVTDKEADIKEICFYTYDYKYKILAIDRKDDDGYLGCNATARKMRAGEDWTRGNDLPDGPFTKETWDRIIISIVRYELQPLSKYAKYTGGI